MFNRVTVNIFERIEVLVVKIVVMVHPRITVVIVKGPSIYYVIRGHFALVIAVTVIVRRMMMIVVMYQ